MASSNHPREKVVYYISSKNFSPLLCISGDDKGCKKYNSKTSLTSGLRTLLQMSLFPCETSPHEFLSLLTSKNSLRYMLDTKLTFWTLKYINHICNGQLEYILFYINFTADNNSIINTDAINQLNFVHRLRPKRWKHYGLNINLESMNPFEHGTLPVHLHMSWGSLLTIARTESIFE